MSKLQVALYLLRHPAWYPDIWRRVRLNLVRAVRPAPFDRSRDAAEAWAAGRAITAADALAALGGSECRLADDFSTEMAEALRLEAQTLQHGFGGSADLIYAVCEAVGARYAVETGVAHGFSSLAILLSLTKRGGHLWSVDMPSPLGGDEDTVGVVVPSSLRPSWTLEQAPDSVGLPKVLAKAPSLDFCHYDSDKAYEGRMLSYPRLWAVLRSGGIFMSDDIGDNTAFRDFAAEIGVAPMTVLAPGSGSSGERYIGLLRKP